MISEAGLAGEGSLRLRIGPKSGGSHREGGLRAGEGSTGEATEDNAEMIGGQELALEAVRPKGGGSRPSRNRSLQGFHATRKEVHA
jgi:hypothetical protein